MYKGSDIVLGLLSKKPLTLEEIANLSSLKEDSVRRILESLKAEGYVTIDTKETVLGYPTDELVKYASTEFPEIAVFKKALGGATISDLSQMEKSIGIRWAKAKGLVVIEGGKLIAAKTPKDVDTLISRLAACANEHPLGFLQL